MGKNWFSIWTSLNLFGSLCVCVCVCLFIGMKNVIDACIECKVTRLICTSSPSVVFDGVHGLFNVDESMPYPEKVVIPTCSDFFSNE